MTDSAGIVTSRRRGEVMSGEGGGVKRRVDGREGLVNDANRRRMKR